MSQLQAQCLPLSHREAWPAQPPCLLQAERARLRRRRCLQWLLLWAVASPWHRQQRPPTPLGSGQVTLGWGWCERGFLQRSLAEWSTLPP